MAEIEPLYLQAGQYDGFEDRKLLSLLLAADHWSVSEDLGGVTTYGALKVSQTGTPSMGVSVAAGLAVVKGTEATGQGYYGAGNDAAVTKTIATAHATNPRRDIVCLRVRDQQYSGSDNDGPIFVVTGTAAAVPVDPTLPVNAIPLARVAVAASATSITNANITDLRVASPVWSRGRGEVAYAQVVASQSGIVAPTDLTGLTVTFTAQDGRRYRIHASARMTQSSNAAVPEMYVTNSANVIQDRRGISVGSGETAAFDVFARVSPSAGSVTYKARATTGAGTVGLVAAADLKAFIQVEDIGGYL